VKTGYKDIFLRSIFTVFKTIFKLGWVGFGSLNVITQLFRKRSFKSYFYNTYFVKKTEIFEKYPVT